MGKPNLPKGFESWLVERVHELVEAAKERIRWSHASGDDELGPQLFTIEEVTPQHRENRRIRASMKIVMECEVSGHFMKTMPDQALGIVYRGLAEVLAEKIVNTLLDPKTTLKPL